MWSGPVLQAVLGLVIELDRVSDKRMRKQRHNGNRLSHGSDPS
jgi:hypothetical protein